VGILFFGGRAEQAVLTARPDRDVVIIDRTGELAEDLRQAFDGHNKAHPKRKFILEIAPVDRADPEAAVRDARDRLRDGRIDAVADIAAGALDHEGGITMTTRSAAATDVVWHDTLTRLVNRAILDVRAPWFAALAATMLWADRGCVASLREPRRPK